MCGYIVDIDEQWKVNVRRTRRTSSCNRREREFCYLVAYRTQRWLLGVECRGRPGLLLEEEAGRIRFWRAIIGVLKTTTVLHYLQNPLGPQMLSRPSFISRTSPKGSSQDIVERKARPVLPSIRLMR
jgi:hypothetical protein